MSLACVPTVRASPSSDSSSRPPRPAAAWLPPPMSVPTRTRRRSSGWSTGTRSRWSRTARPPASHCSVSMRPDWMSASERRRRGPSRMLAAGGDRGASGGVRREPRCRLRRRRAGQRGAGTAGAGAHARQHGGHRRGAGRGGGGDRGRRRAVRRGRGVHGVVAGGRARGDRCRGRRGSVVATGGSGCRGGGPAGSRGRGSGGRGSGGDRHARRRRGGGGCRRCWSPTCEVGRQR